jgi:hypothetical protein
MVNEIFFELWWKSCLIFAGLSLLATVVTKLSMTVAKWIEK